MARSTAAYAPRRIAERPAPAARRVPRALGGALRAIRAGGGLVHRRRRLRIALIAAVAAMPLLAGGWLLARHTSLTAVEHVQVEGLLPVHGAQAAPGPATIETALRSAARGMSTLAVDTAALRAAVARYPIVRAVRTHASFPHGLLIEVVERPAVAALAAGGVRTAVAADGTVLGPAYLSSSLPLVSVPGTAPAKNGAAALPAAGGRVRGATLLQALSLLGAAPPRLARAVTRVYSGQQGLTALLRGGLLAYFGDGTRARAKWIALTRVLADPGSAGASYIDVRLPERPAAGFAPGASRPLTSSAEAEQTSALDAATAAELAAGLNAAVGGGSETSSGSEAGREEGVGAAGQPGAAGEPAQAGSPGSEEALPSTTPSAVETGSTSGREASSTALGEAEAAG